MHELNKVHMVPCHSVRNNTTVTWLSSEDDRFPFAAVKMHNQYIITQITDNSHNIICWYCDMSVLCKSWQSIDHYYTTPLSEHHYFSCCLASYVYACEVHARLTLRSVTSQDENLNKGAKSEFEFSTPTSHHSLVGVSLINRQFTVHKIWCPEPRWIFRLESRRAAAKVCSCMLLKIHRSEGSSSQVKVNIG